VSTLRARCPDCRTLTAVAVDTEYQCHACGREFASGLVRVPTAWGKDGDMMAAAANMELPWPEAAVVEEATLADEIVQVAHQLPARPFILGGSCCGHIGAVRELARRHGRVGIVWLDSHGDLNTPESSPTGNVWGMPLRMLIENGDVDPGDVTLLGARNLDSPEVEFIAEAGIRQELGPLPDKIYVALDLDVILPGDLDVFMPEPGGPTFDELERLLAALPTPIGAGFTGGLRTARNEALLPRLGAALAL
jgi:arginase family enzyme